MAKKASDKPLAPAEEALKRQKKQARQEANVLQSLDRLVHFEAIRRRTPGPITCKDTLGIAAFTSVGLDRAGCSVQSTHSSPRLEITRNSPMAVSPALSQSRLLARV